MPDFDFLHSEHFASKTSLQSTGDAIAREAELVWSGTTHGISDSAHKAKTDWKSTALEFGLSAMAGYGIACLSAGTGGLGLLGRGAAAGFALSTVYELCKPGRITALAHIVKDTWASGDNLQRNTQIFADLTGGYLFKSLAIGAVGGTLGAGLAELRLAGPGPFLRPAESRAFAAAEVAQPKLLESKMEMPSATPLNAWSRSPEEIGRQISNFAHTPFVLDGKRYESIEAFYAGLLYLDRARRAEIAEMWGIDARKAGSSSNLKVTTYGGKQFALGSDQHHALIARALEAKFRQNPRLADDLVDTLPRTIIHDTGIPDPRSFLPNDKFAQMLTDLRKQLADERATLGTRFADGYR